MADKMTDEEWRAFVSEGTRTGKLSTVRADGSPHVAPIWFLLDGDDLVFTTGKDTVKGRNLARDGRIALCVDDDRPPFHFAVLNGRARLSEDLADVRLWATRIAARYMGEDRAEGTARATACRGSPRPRHRRPCAGHAGRRGLSGRFSRPSPGAGRCASARRTRPAGSALPCRVAVACIAQHHGCAVVEVERPGDVVGAMRPGSREAVDGHHERDVPVLESSRRRGKQSSSRRVSARTTAPRAPWASSSHRNQKRSCPGVPKR